LKSDEFIREVEEDLRHDQLKKLWDEFGLFIIAAVLLIVLGTGGFVGFDAWQDSKAQALAEDYRSAVEAASGAGGSGGDLSKLEAFAASADPGFAAVARLRAAGLAAGEQTDDTAFLAQVADDGSVDVALRDFARISLASRLLDEGNTGDANALLMPMSAEEGPYRQTAQEFLALSALEDGDRETATSRIQELLDDPMLPGGQRQRLDELLAALGGARE
jgi:hypothetical protein